MSSKSGTDGKRWSLAARLSAWYAASTFLLLLFALGLLSWTLVYSFDDEDERYLQEKINVMRALLRDRARNAEVIEWEVKEEAFARPGARVFSRVVAPDGRVLSESEGMAQELPLRLLPAAKPGAKGFETIVGTTTYRVVSVLLEGGYTVQVAIDLKNEKDLLARFHLLG